MNIKINTICFILLIFFLIGAVCAADDENETQTIISQPNPTDEIDNEELKTLEEDDDNEILLSQSTEYERENTEIIESEIKVENTKPVLGKSATETVLTKSKQKVSLKAPNVKMYYKDGSKFKVILKNNKNKAMKNTKVKISINGATYNRETNSNGIASLSLNLKSGTYNAVSSYAGSGTYEKQSVKSTVTIKSTIKSNDFSKYYTNTEAYSSTFYNAKGQLLKSTAVKFKLNGKTYSVKTNSKGVGKLNINLKPGKYTISIINSKTSETVTKTITIKNILETHDLTMKESDGSKFKVKILDSKGKVAANKKVTLKVNSKTYTSKSDSNGIAALTIDLEPGKYSIITEYEGLKNTNQIIVNKIVKDTSFSHITLIPNYVNVTTSYVFHNSAYVLKTGFNGIIKMPKNEIFTVQISETKGYVFSQSAISGIDSIVIGYKSHLIPFDGSPIQSDYNKANLKGNGIIISKSTHYTEIEYRSNTEDNTDLFGVYMDKGSGYSETVTYLQNNKIKAKINFFTQGYDELGLKYNLAKFYGKNLYDFNYKSYDEMTNNNADLIKFANTNTSVTFNYFGRAIVGYPIKEEIITKFIVNGKEENEKIETISYGLSDKYRTTLGFEVLQSYAIINEKTTPKILENWLSKSSAYLDKFGIMNVYGMFLASLETSWLADEMASKYSSEFDVTWKRSNTLTILGGINLEDTYLHILNADMGMEVTGNKENVQLFRMINSIGLPNIEDYVLTPVADRFMDSTSNSLDSILSSLANNTFSITQIGELMYVFSSDNTAIILNTTSGVCDVILSHENSVYKGSKIHTSEDCCGVGIMPKDIIKDIRSKIPLIAPGLYYLSDKFNKIHPLSTLAYKGISFILGKTLSGASQAAFGLFTTMVFLQDGGVKYRDTMMSEKDWHSAMDSVTFTRPGYLQGKKVYNIPNKNGGTDYVEVKINDDLTLDRDSVKYISYGKTKQLTKQETYQYFSEDYWTPFSMPTKYWDKSWKGD